VTQALALAEPEQVQRRSPNEGSPATGLPARHGRSMTTRDTTAFLLRAPLTMPQLPFMHNVLAKRRAGGASA
jgi:hypothetical protein